MSRTMQDKINAYDAATRVLEHQVDFMRTPPEFKPLYNMSDTVRKFRSAFLIPDLRNAVLAKKYERERINAGRFSAGFCGIASYTWAHLFRMPNGDALWRIKHYKNNRTRYGLSDHVWMESKFDGSVLDLAFDQSVDESGTFVEIPYDLGVDADEYFEFGRAYKFAEYLGMKINFPNIVRENMAWHMRAGRD